MMFVLCLDVKAWSWAHGRALDSPITEINYFFQIMKGKNDISHSFNSICYVRKISCHIMLCFNGVNKKHTNVARRLIFAAENI